MFVYVNNAGEIMERSTWLSAAKFTTVSGFSSQNTLSTAAVSVISALTNLNLGESIIGFNVLIFPA